MDNVRYNENNLPKEALDKTVDEVRKLRFKLYKYSRQELTQLKLQLNEYSKSKRKRKRAQQSNGSEKNANINKKGNSNNVVIDLISDESENDDTVETNSNDLSTDDSEYECSEGAEY
jgi:pyruvate/2-oxoacid:ferredoxin oxidoreductase beta subunit